MKGTVSELDASGIRALGLPKTAPGPTYLLRNLGKLFNFSVPHFPNV